MRRKRRKTMMKSLVMLAACACLQLFSASVHADAPVASLSDGRTGRISFRVAAGATNLWSLVNASYSASDVISGDLRLPEGATGRVPAMVISHGSGGLAVLEYAWAQLFESMGIATFVIDHFSGRGFTSTYSDQSRINSSVIPADALLALRLLATHPRIDASRIGHIGLSKGGAAAMMSAYERLRAAILPEGTRFALHLPFYPGGRVRANVLTGAPIRVFMGDLDDYDSVDSTRGTVNYLRAAGGDVELTVYAGAYHAFDASFQPLWVADAQTDASCPTSLNIDSFAVVNPLTGTEIPGVSSSNLSAYLVSCRSLGVMLGGNEAACAQARQAVWSFVRQRFGLGGIPETLTPPGDTERILNWAEFQYRAILADRGGLQQGLGYTYRCYAGGVCAGTGGDRVYYYDGAAIQDVGALADYLGAASGDGM